MKIIGEEYLANNTYSSIIVNNDKIIVSGTSEISLPCDYEFVKELKNSAKEKQIGAITKRSQ